MTLKQWVDATSKWASFPEDARPSILVTAYDALIGNVEEEETQKLDTKNTCVHLSFSSPPPYWCTKKPLNHPSLSK